MDEDSTSQEVNTAQVKPYKSSVRIRIGSESQTPEERVEQSQHGSPEEEEEEDEYEESAPAESRIASSVQTLNINPFGFEARTSYNATEDLLNTRSSSFKFRPPPPDDDIWKRPPPDFRPQVYAPKPPKRNSRDAVQPWKYGTIPGQKEVVKREESVKLPHILQAKSVDEGIFQTTHFNIPDPYEAKLWMVKHGMYKAGMYHMPQPHDFRGYPPIKSLGLPEFETTYEKDPYNIHFNSNRLNIHHGINLNPPSERDIRGRQMAPPLIQPPKWEARLIYPKDSWPEKYNAYTRFRRMGRVPKSALMERIDDHLSAQWAKEKMERVLSSKSAGAME